MQQKEQYLQEFLDLRPKLKSYLFRLTTNKQDAEDLTQDTYLKVSKSISTFKGNSSFKTWVFSIATNLARDHFRVKQRWGEDWMDVVRDVHVANPDLFAKKKSILEESPEGKFILSEHLNYCFNCTTKTLLLNEQICLWLKEVYGFKVFEIMAILNLSEGKVKHALADARKHLSRIFEHKCALINKEGTCSQCTGLNQIYNPEQDAHIEANKLKLVRERNDINNKARLDLRLELVKALDPLEGRTTSLHTYLLENSPTWVEHQAQLNN